MALFSLIDQKFAGHLERIEANGTLKFEILLVNFLFNSAISLIQTVLMLGFDLFLLHIPSSGSLWLLTSLVALSGLSGVGQATLIGCLISRRVDAMMVLSAISHMLYFACCIMWPLQAIQWDWVKPIIQLLPLTMPAESARAIMNQGLGMTSPLVWPGFVLSIVGLVAPMLLTLKLFNTKSIV